MLHTVRNPDAMAATYTLEPDNMGPYLLIIAGICWIMLWLFLLGAVLNRKDLDAGTRIAWVLVLIFVPFFGVLLYFFSAPARSKVKKIDPASPTSGTPWESNPGFTTKARK